jgi:predicted enzyme related to lactoylglutathione lyase
MEIQVNLDCTNPQRLVDFYTAALDYEFSGHEAQQYYAVKPKDGNGPKLVFQRVAEAKRTKNRMHLDLVIGEGIEAEAKRFVDLGATRVTEEPISEYGCRWIVMQDPEGNELCLCDH